MSDFTLFAVGDVLLDVYEVKQLFEGGMGHVYRVHHLGWNVDLAMKCPRPELLERAGAIEIFQRECDLWINLGLHPHIATCHYVKQTDGVPRIFAEFVEGGSLREWILTRRLYRGGEDAALARILDVAIQFAWGLDFAHSHRLVHQDVKPGNVLLTPDGTVKVTDFGLAKVCRVQVSPKVANTPIFVSSGGMTPAYCSPEQAAGTVLTVATDIWSWAVSILEMFTGGIIWNSGVLAKAVLEDFRAHGLQLRSLPAMPHALFKLLRYCFRSKPENRPGNFREIVVCLTDIYAEVHGEQYWREPPDTDFFAIDALNNRAVSLLDIGQESEAMNLFKQALQADPLHPEANFNSGLIMLRAGNTTDDFLLAQLDRVSKADVANWIPKYLIAQVFIELGRTDAALRSLEVAESQACDDNDIASIKKLRESAKTPKLKQSPNRSRQPFVLALPRTGAEHSNQAAKMKRLVQKAQIAHHEGRMDDAARYVARLLELPGFARHPEVRKIILCLQSK